MWTLTAWFESRQEQLFIHASPCSSSIYELTNYYFYIPGICKDEAMSTKGIVLVLMTNISSQLFYMG